QHVRLVLGLVDATAQGAIGQPGVMSRAYRVEAQRDSPVEDRRELDLLIAAQAWVGGAAARVLGDEILDHVAVEALSHVPDVERDADDAGGAAGGARAAPAAAARP